MKHLSHILREFFKNQLRLAHDPARDWLMLLGGSLILLAASMSWNMWFFDRIVQEGAESANADGGSFEAYDANAVKMLFEARAQAAEAYRRTHSFVDPSR